MKIITTPDPRLREKSEKVTKIDDEILGIIENMRKLSLDWEKEHPYELSAAMAAPQMGANKRIIIVRDDMADKSKATFTALINPEVIKAEGKIIRDFEGCLSVPNKAGMVTRPNYVKARAFNEDMEEYEIEGTELLARAICHELDHLDGHLYVEKVEGELMDATYDEDEE